MFLRDGNLHKDDFCSCLLSASLSVLLPLHGICAPSRTAPPPRNLERTMTLWRGSELVCVPRPHSVPGQLRHEHGTCRGFIMKCSSRSHFVEPFSDLISGTTTFCLTAVVCPKQTCLSLARLSSPFIVTCVCKYIYRRRFDIQYYTLQNSR